MIALDLVGKSGLYRIEWTEYDEDLVTGIAETGATVLEWYGCGTTSAYTI